MLPKINSYESFINIKNSVYLVVPYLFNEAGKVKGH